MITATGTFKNKQGDSYTVTFSKASGSGSYTLQLASNPVVIKYDKPDIKFGGLRPVSCSVRVVTSTHLDYLYADSNTAVSCVVQGSGTVFRGYVVPFSYNQPYTLCNDEVEIMCVDAMSAIKDTVYKGTVGPKATALSYLQDIAKKAGITTIILQESFSAGTCPIASKQIYPQAFLPEDPKSTDGMTYEEVINGITTYFGLNALVWGDVLYLIDTYAINHHTAGYMAYKYTWNGIIWSRTSYYTATSPLNSQLTVSASMFRGTSNQYSIEQSYDGLSIDLDKTKLVLMPDPLGNVKPGARGASGEQSYTIDGEPGKWKATVLDNVGVSCVVKTADGVTANITSGMLAGTTAWKGAIAIKGQDMPPKAKAMTKGGDYDAQAVTKSEYNLIWFRNQFVPYQIENFDCISLESDYARYSDGRPFRIKASIGAKRESNYDKNMPPTHENGTLNITSTNFFTLKCGEKYYNWDRSARTFPIDTKWGASFEASPITFMGDEGDDTIGFHDIFWTSYAWERYESGWIDSAPEGKLGLSFNLVNTSSSSYILNYWLKGISVEVADLEEEDAYDSELKMVFAGRGTRDTETSQILDTKVILCSKVHDYARVINVLPTDDFGAAYLAATGGNTKCGVTGIYAVQLAKYYNEPRKVYQLQLSDDVKPWSKVTIDNNAFSVDAMEWDVKESVRTVIID